MTAPCDCCPVAGAYCAVSPVQFASVAQTVAQAGWNPTSLAATADGIFNTGALSGYTTGGATIPSTTLRVEYTTTGTRNRVRGLRLYNQGGSDLGDADGLGTFTAEYYNGATLLFTQACQGFNGGQAFDQILPGDASLDGVTRVVLRNLGTQGNVNGVKPLWRELFLLEEQPVFPCRRANGVIEYYNEDGTQAQTADLRPCGAPLALPGNLRMTGAAFGDDPGGIAENVCNIAPAPSAQTGWQVAPGGCLDPVSGAPTLDWTNVSGIELEYGQSSAGGSSGGVFMQYSIPGTGGGSFIWPAMVPQMNPGDVRWSTNSVAGRRARLTYVSGPLGTDPSGSIRTDGNANVVVHFSNVSAAPRIRYRVDLFAA